MLTIHGHLRVMTEINDNNETVSWRHHKDVSHMTAGSLQ